jgi:hypothetical protein
MNQPRSSGAAVTASASTTAIIALTCAASNLNLSSRSICPLGQLRQVLRKALLERLP